MTFTASDIITIILAVLGFFFAIIGTLFMMKVNRMDTDITALEKENTERLKEINELKLKISETHPTKDDMTGMFAQFKSYLDERFNAIENIARYIGTHNESDRRNKDRGDNGHGC